MERGTSVRKQTSASIRETSIRWADLCSKANLCSKPFFFISRGTSVRQANFCLQGEPLFEERLSVGKANLCSKDKFLVEGGTSGRKSSLFAWGRICANGDQPTTFVGKLDQTSRWDCLSSPSTQALTENDCNRVRLSQRTSANSIHRSSVSRFADDASISIHPLQSPQRDHFETIELEWRVSNKGRDTTSRQWRSLTSL